MNLKDKTIKKVEDLIRDSNIADTILSIFKTGLSFTKYSPFASLISDYIPNKRFLRLEKFACELTSDLKKLEERIDVNFITTDEFAFIFEQCFKAASENYQNEKLESFKAIIVNSAIGNKMENDEREFFLNLTNSLTVLHLKILKFLSSPRKYLSDNNISETKISGGFNEFMPNVFSSVDIETIKMAFNDLYTNNLINTSKEIFGSMTSSQGFGLLGDRISKNGRRYLQFITQDLNNMPSH